MKNLNVKVFNLMSRANETNHIKRHETCNCKCRLDPNVCYNKKLWNDDKCWYEYKELIDKDVCDKGCIWNPSNCGCECDKSCDVGVYLDYKNCEYRKRLVDKLVEECKETSVVKINATMCKLNSCILHIVLFSIIFTVNLGIETYFFYYKCMNHNKGNGSKYDYAYHSKNYSYRWGKLNKLILKVELNISTMAW